MDLRSELDQYCDIHMSDCDKAWFSGFMFLLICMVFTVASSFAGDGPRFDIDSRIKKEIGWASVEVYPHSAQCRRVHQVVEEQNYLVCLVRGELEAYEMRELKTMGMQRHEQSAD